MRIELKNIGILTKASVELNGLTVIVGENDAGKSTVGKVLFCVIKAISRYSDFQMSKFDKADKILDELFFILRKELNKRDFDLFLDSDVKVRHEIIRMESFNTLSFFLDKIQSKSLFTKIKADKLLKDLKETLARVEDKQKSISNALTKIFRSEFDSSIISYGSEEGKIKLYEKDLLLIDITINKDNSISISNDIQPIEVQEATFVETPLIFNNNDLLARAQSGIRVERTAAKALGQPYVMFHTKDLFDKLRLIQFDEINSEEGFYQNINNIISGEVLYDREKEDFIFSKNKQSIPIKNTATGIKAFGLVKILLQNGFLNRKSLLILDEPEIHLHPKWQLKYAELIVYLVKNGVPIMITSHSPYMIEALKRYSDKFGQTSNFYLSQDGVIENKDKLSEIFSVLSEPFEDFRKMDRELLKDA